MNRPKMSMKARAVEVNRPTTMRGIALPPNTNFFPWKNAGIYTFDVIPFKVSQPERHPHMVEGLDIWPESTFSVHRNLGPEGRDTEICIMKTYGKPCPVCEFRNRLPREDEEAALLAKNLMPQARILFNVIDLNDKKAGIKILDQSMYNFGEKLFAKIQHANEGNKLQAKYKYFAELEEGMTLRVTTKAKKTPYGEFQEITGIEFEERDYDYSEDILNDSYDLDAMLVPLSYEELEALLHCYMVKYDSDSNSGGEPSTDDVHDSETDTPTKDAETKIVKREKVETVETKVREDLPFDPTTETEPEVEVKKIRRIVENSAKKDEPTSEPVRNTDKETGNRTLRKSEPKPETKSEPEIEDDDFDDSPPTTTRKPAADKKSTEMVGDDWDDNFDDDDDSKFDDDDFED